MIYRLQIITLKRNEPEQGQEEGQVRMLIVVLRGYMWFSES